MRQADITMHSSHWIDMLQVIAAEADRIARHYCRNRNLRVIDKSERSLVTEADLAIETSARRYIEQRYPGVGICGEEFAEIEAAQGTRLIIDPIDATENFIRGIPIFATLLAIE